MSNTFNFEFKQSYKEVTIAGENFRVNFDDDAMLAYQVAFKEYEKKVAEVQSLVKDYSTASAEELRAMADKQKEITKEALELFLGEGTFEGLYDKAGRSSMNMISLIDMLMKMVEEELLAQAGEVNNKYLANLKK
jgi:CHASE3 domain sensor protein